MSAALDWSLLARYLSGECSGEETKQVQLWLASSPENERLIEFMQTVWTTPAAEDPECDVNALWSGLAAKAGIGADRTEQVDDQAATTTTRSLKLPGLFQADNYRLWRYAAIFALLLTTGYVLRSYFPWFGNKEGITIHVNNGQRQTLTLSDGSVIVLDAGTTLRYPERFTPDSRAIFLSGEAYFAVTPDSKRPFIVHTDRTSIRVLGTKFNVRAWQPDENIIVAVTEGQVAVGRNHEIDRTVILTQGQASSVAQDGTPSQPFEFDPELQLGWMQNEFAFSNTPLKTILFHLNRRYDMRFILEDSSVAEERLNLHVGHEKLTDILELLGALTGLQYRYEGNSVILTPGSESGLQQR